MQPTLIMITFQTLLTCLLRGYIDKPPCQNPGQNHNDSLSPLQSTGFCKCTAKFPGQISQFLKTLSHFFSISTHPSEGWIGISLSNLRKDNPVLDLKVVIKLNSTLIELQNFFLKKIHRSFISTYMEYLEVTLEFLFLDVGSHVISSSMCHFSFSLMVKILLSIYSSPNAIPMPYVLGVTFTLLIFAF